MGTQISFTPLLGALSDGPLAYALEVDGLKLVLDCGWSDAYSTAAVAPLVQACPSSWAVRIAYLCALHTCSHAGRHCSTHMLSLQRIDSMQRPACMSRIVAGAAGCQGG